MHNFILVTGSSGGIGKEIAINLSQNNNIILHGRDSEKLEQIKGLCSKNTIQLIWEYDLNIISEIENSLADFIGINNINIIKFVHCAGFMKLAPLKVTSFEILCRTFNINCISATLICKTLNNKKANNSRLENVVFISSNISNFGAKALCAYGASKSALDAIMRSLAVELAPKIRVNSILPGAILTEMTEQIFSNDEVKSRMDREYPLGLGNVNDIFNIVDFLLSEQSRWVTGQQFTVDGGRTINISA